MFSPLEWILRRIRIASEVVQMSASLMRLLELVSKIEPD